MPSPARLLSSKAPTKVPASKNPVSTEDPVGLAAMSAREAAAAARDAGVIESLRTALHAGNGAAKKVSDLATAIFPEAEPEVSRAAVARSWKVSRRSRTRATRSCARTSFSVTWPACGPARTPSARQSRTRRPTRTVGKLHAEPATRCECGARVLELLYCQNCGDVFLGGFAPEGEPPAAGRYDHAPRRRPRAGQAPGPGQLAAHRRQLHRLLAPGPEEPGLSRLPHLDTRRAGRRVLLPPEHTESRFRGTAEHRERSYGLELPREGRAEQ